MSTTFEKGGRYEVGLKKLDMKPCMGFQVVPRSLIDLGELTWI